MATNNDGWTVANAAEQQAYAAAMLPSAPPGKRGKTGPAGPAASGDMLELPKDRDSTRQALDLANRIQPQLDRVRQLYTRNLKGSGPVTSLMEYLPTQSNAQFDSAAGELKKLVRPATRTVGEGAMSDFESKLALQALPTRYAFDGSNEESLEGLQRFLDTSRASYAKRLGLPTPPPAARKAPAKEFTIDRNGNLIR